MVSLGGWMRRGMATMLCVMLMGIGMAVAQSKKAPPKKKNGAEAAKTSDVAKGRQVYSENCSICHFAKSKEKKIGPGLEGIFKRGKFADGKKVDEASMRAWIEKGGEQMPPFDEVLSKQQIEDLVAFLKTI